MMAASQFVTVRETAQLLAISEKKVMDLIEERKLQAYRIANKFLRLKKNEVLGLRNSGNIVVENIQYDYTPSEKMQDFFYYNNFYLISVAIIFILLYIILFV